MCVECKKNLQKMFNIYYNSTCKWVRIKTRVQTILDRVKLVLLFLEGSDPRKKKEHIRNDHHYRHHHYRLLHLALKVGDLSYSVLGYLSPFYTFPMSRIRRSMFCCFHFPTYLTYFKTPGCLPRETSVLQLFSGQWFFQVAFLLTYYMCKEFQNSLIAHAGQPFINSMFLKNRLISPQYPQHFPKFHR